ncbi:unnamed protein product [Leptidea sinapis]|uniref:Pinin/SDK/MemA protein domain-containing protein n=1 Tax=Leptidea sinapis TaxID=189913 RepID=A0A5E4Q1Y3_9NEOP|nr:unnamed protein product [Leptidea sinapis]
MGTEVALSFNALRNQLENERNSLFKLDENIKKIVQTSGRYNASGDHLRGGPRLGGRSSFQDFNKNDDPYNKRKQETKTVFSRLSKGNDSDGEDGPGTKRPRMPSAVSRELPTRASVLRAQGDDEQARTRNRRIFGSLLGTLQKFKQEEIVLQTKEEKKAQVERKIEEQARLEKEKELKERRVLFAERETKKANIKTLEAKMMRVQEFEKWEESQRHLGHFILTKAKPHVYWLPKRMSERASEKLNSSRRYYDKCMTKKREELQEELLRIEQRCLRQKLPGAKENEPNDELGASVKSEIKEENDERSKKRDKFAADADDKGDDTLNETAIDANNKQSPDRNIVESVTQDNEEPDMTAAPVEPEPVENIARDTEDNKSNVAQPESLIG